MLNSASNSPNCYSILDSHDIAKNDAHPLLIRATIHDGWLIPFGYPFLILHYMDRFKIQKTYDPIIDMSIEIRELVYQSLDAENRKKQNSINLLSYASEKQTSLKNLLESGDYVAEAFLQEYDLLKKDVEEKNKIVERKKLECDFKFLSFDEVLSSPPKEWLIDQILGKKELGMIYGASGVGKTFVVLDLMICACLGKKWAHRFQVNKPLNVAYCSSEGHNGFGGRLRTACKHHNIPSLPNFSYSKVVPQFFTKDISSHFSRFIHTWQNLKKDPLDLLVIDTLHAASTGADENSAKDMGEIIVGCQKIIEVLGCTVLLIHHTNKNELVERGSNSLRGSCDFVLNVARDKSNNSTSILSCSKSKDSDLWLPQKFTLLPIKDCDSVHVAWDDPCNSNEARKKSKEEKLCDEIISIFQAQRGRMFRCSEIGKYIAESPLATQRLLKKLVQDGSCNIISQQIDEKEVLFYGLENY